MQARLVVVSDTLTPDLARRYKAIQDKVPIHQAMGMAVVSLTKRAFNEPGLRPSTWANKVDGTPATLRKSGTMAKSPRVTAATQAGAMVGSDRIQAAIHQLGGSTPPHIIRPKNKKALSFPGMKGGPYASVKHPGSKIPPRPFFPFDATGRPTQSAIDAIARVVRIKVEA